MDIKKLHPIARFNDKSISETPETTIIVAESGADIPLETAHAHGIHILPMHVSFGGKDLDDGAFPVRHMFEHFRRNRELPKTSAVSPGEYRSLFERLHAEHPNSKILHLCYSAVTTATYENAIIGSSDMDYVTHVDTKEVSFGQGAVVLEIARYIKEHPNASIQKLMDATRERTEKMRLCFLPDTLDYLVAGGRVSNMAQMGAALLKIKPLIEVIDGKLLSTKKYHGSMRKACCKLTHDYIEKYRPDKTTMHFLYSEELGNDIRDEVGDTAAGLGYKGIGWLPTGGVISSHCGPGAFGISGFSTT